MIQKYSIVKLIKGKYQQDKVTPEDPAPRVLVIKAYEDSRQYLVRYPNNFVHRVNEDWLTTKSTFTMDHPEYYRIAMEMPAVEQEYRRSEIFRHVLVSDYQS
jgi:hypothetical protein